MRERGKEREIQKRQRERDKEKRRGSLIFIAEQTTSS
jgi:hypothetical protein